MSTYPSLDGLREVVMVEPVFEQFVAWVEARGWHVFRIPETYDGETPAYAISPWPRPVESGASHDETPL